MTSTQPNFGTSYVYVKSRGESVWTVGFYAPDGSWEPETDHPDSESAARRVHYLNGGLTDNEIRLEELIREAGAR